MPADCPALQVEIGPQPDDSSCGPTCLHALYRYFGKDVPLSLLIKQITTLETGGTLAVYLGQHALEQGFRASLYTFNLKVFDPTWFSLDRARFIAKLEASFKHRHSQRRRRAITAYLDFLRLGGDITMRDISAPFLNSFLNRHIPILTGLSSTYLYQQARDSQAGGDDDLGGEPAGHFVVLSGYDPSTREYLVADPYPRNPFAGNHYYRVKSSRLITSILLGILTYDGNLLIVTPPA